MKHLIELLIRVALMGLIWLIWWWALQISLSPLVNMVVIIGGVVLAVPAVWLGRKLLDRHLTANQVSWTTTFVHASLGIFLAIPLIRAIATHQDWPGWSIPMPPSVGIALVSFTGAAFLLTVINLALKGMGAPFFIALTRRLSVDWLYAWTRNPMVLAVVALLLSLGLWFQSTLFVLWVALLFAPALLAFVKIYEERELQIRFGQPYLEYKSRTPMLIPRMPRV